MKLETKIKKWMKILQNNNNIHLIGMILMWKKSICIRVSDSHKESKMWHSYTLREGKHRNETNTFCGHADVWT